MNYVHFFIYGPLIEGGYDSGSIPEGSVFVKNVILDTKMYLTPYGYPVITFEKGRSKGSLYKIPADKIAELDGIEGYYKSESNDLTIRKSFKYGDLVVYTYVASNKFLDIVKEFNVEIEDGNWLNFYNKHWMQYEDQTPQEISGYFSAMDIDEICKEFDVDSIDEVNTLLESSIRYSIMLEAKNNKIEKTNKNPSEMDVTDEDPQDAPVLDDLTEPDPAEAPADVVEPEKPAEVPHPEVSTEEPEPSLADLDEPVETPKAPTSAPPQPATIPSTKELPPSEKKEEPEVAVDWKKEKHLRTLYNNYFKVFPKNGSSKNIDVKFTTIKADALHPDSKYLQANVTSICESESAKGRYYNQWMQLRRQRITQNWSVDLPCEVRCNCKSFIYTMAYSNVKNKSLAGAVTRTGKLDGKIINYNIPSNKTNPNYIPALCKHLMALTNEIFDMNSGKVNKSNVV